MEMMTRWPWLIPLRDMSQIPLLFIGIHGMDLTTGLPTTVTIAMNIDSHSLTCNDPDLRPHHFMHLGYFRILSKISRLATVVAYGS